MVVTVRARPVQPLVALCLGLQATAAPQADTVPPPVLELPFGLWAVKEALLPASTLVVSTYIVKVSIVLAAMCTRPITLEEAQAALFMTRWTLRTHG